MAASLRGGPLCDRGARRDEHFLAETSLTGDSAPPASSSSLSSVTVSDQTDRWYEFDITALVRDAKAAARPAVSVAMMAGSASAKSSVAFSSKEGGNPLQFVIAP